MGPGVPPLPIWPGAPPPDDDSRNEDEHERDREPAARCAEWHGE